MSGVPGVGAQASNDTLGFDGADPVAVSLTWTPTTDSCFVSYAIQYSVLSANGPWITMATETNPALAGGLAYGLTVSSTYWWQIVDTDCVGSQPSNVLQVNLPAVASLTFTQPTSTSVRFAWDNRAWYGGILAFSSYQIMESASGGMYAPVATVSTEATTTYTLEGLSPGASYQFYLATTDGSTASATRFASESNVVSLSVVRPLVVSATANPGNAFAGQSVTLTCTVSGGSGTYASYAWDFGDGSNGSGRTVAHTYRAAGTVRAVCNVTDTLGDQGNASVNLTVTQGLLGLPLSPTIGIFVLGAFVALVVAAFVLWRRRKRAPKPPETPPTPPSPPA